MWIITPPSSTILRASAAYSAGVYGIAGHWSRLATAPEIAQVMIAGSSTLTPAPPRSRPHHPAHARTTPLTPAPPRSRPHHPAHTGPTPLTHAPPRSHPPHPIATQR